MRARLAFVISITTLPAMAADFRSAEFGMSPDQVRASEPGVEWIESGDRLGFETRIGTVDALAVYEFTDDRFSTAMYTVTEEHVNKTLFIDDYRELAGLLEQKYGKPDEDETVWRNDLYRDDPSDWGTAVGVGHLTMYKQWHTETTDVSIVLFGDNFEVHVQIAYQSRDLAAERAERDRQRALDAL